MSFSFLFFLFFFLTRIIAGQWWPQPRCHPLTHTQVLTALTPSPVQPTGPVASTSDTCSRHQPDPTTTATTRTVAAPTAAARPTPAQKYSDKFFLFFPSHLNLTGQWRPHHCHHLHLPHLYVGNPTHVPYCQNCSPPLQRPCHCPNHGHFSRCYLDCRHPNCHCCHPSHRAPTVTAPTPTATPIPSPPPHQLPPCPLYHLTPTCSATPPTLVLVPCIYLNPKYIIFYA